MSVKSGPLTQAELLELWKSVTDKGYHEPFLAAGEGGGLEAHTQLQAVLARASRAVDTTTQAMFILPWSGQTSPPASGGQRARVTLTFQRLSSQFPQKAMVIGAGLVFVEEQQLDSSTDGSVEVLTGRRYSLLENLVFPPGESGPLSAVAEAEKEGYGYNNPLPGTIRAVTQQGASFNNDGASVEVFGPVAIGAGAAASAHVRAANEPDMFVPEHVGQYLTFVAGANVGKTARIISFEPPDASLSLGSRVQLQVAQSVATTSHSGTFTPGEALTIVPAGEGIVLGEHGSGSTRRLTFVRTFGSTLAPGDTLAGVLSGATATVGTVLEDGVLAAETGTAAWRIVDWVVDFGLSVSNAQSPDGGLSAWLDELGAERNIRRSPGEGDDSYRSRIATIADVVTPNAIRRAISRVVGTLPWCLREVGTRALPGWFYDGDNSPPSATPHGAMNDAYDTDVIIIDGVLTGIFEENEAIVLENVPAGTIDARGYFGRLALADTRLTFVRKSGSVVDGTLLGKQVRGLHSGAVFAPASTTSFSVPNSVRDRRFRVYLDYSQFRGFFLVTIPRLGIGDFGMAYDVGLHDAYDASPYLAFYDGFPAGDAIVYTGIYQAVDAVRMGGVLFDLVLDDGPCP